MIGKDDYLTFNFYNNLFSEYSKKICNLIHLLDEKGKLYNDFNKMIKNVYINKFNKKYDSQKNVNLSNYLKFVTDLQFKQLNVIQNCCHESTFVILIDCLIETFYIHELEHFNLDENIMKLFISIDVYKNLLFKESHPLSFILSKILANYMIQFDDMEKYISSYIVHNILIQKRIDIDNFFNAIYSIMIYIPDELYFKSIFKAAIVDSLFLTECIENTSNYIRFLDLLQVKGSVSQSQFVLDYNIIKHRIKLYSEKSNA
ncbi:hypothetical protein A3Q56_02424 [Intoshia linei]|uniref:Uncharacterized protein n=1 Tax=Intoshia linei TaxID=1819745 RepID=A0A177B6C1_9BILA|nr:hypothetical protein A3Q56_02424 [Intoshia linei]